MLEQFVNTNPTAEESAPSQKLRTNARRGVSAALALVLTTSGLAGCKDLGEPAGTPPPPDHRHEVTTQAYTYRGRDLLCRVAMTAYGYSAYDCDFTGFYGDPDYVTPASMPRIKIASDNGDTTGLGEYDVAYQGGTLHCLTYWQSSDNVGETCDYPRFHSEKQ